MSSLIKVQIEGLYKGYQVLTLKLKINGRKNNQLTLVDLYFINADG